jgi:ligand-binding sensor domain-containing protein/signal transduction histidine kinase
MGIFRAILMAIALGAAATIAAYAAETNSEPSFSVKTWQSEDGLPQNSVFALAQTRDGYLWIGTGDKGLARFDGVRFKTFALPEFDASTRIVKLYEDSEGNLWVGTDRSGVLRIDPQGGISVPLANRNDSDGALISITDDGHGAVWLSMARGQLYRFQNGKAAQILSNHRLFAADNSGLIWIGTPDHRRLIALGPFAGSSAAVAHDIDVGNLDFLAGSKAGGVWVFASGKITRRFGEKVIEDLGAYPWSSYADISAVVEDADGRLIIATYGDGVYWQSSGGHFSHISGSQGLSHSYVFSLCFDQQRNLWVGTDGGGLNRVLPQLFQVLTPSRALTVQSISEDTSDRIWFSINNGGVAAWDGSALKEYREKQGLEDLYVRAVLADKHGTIWAGSSSRGLFQLRNGKFVQAPGWSSAQAEISSLYEASDGKLLVGTSKGLASWDEQKWTTLIFRSPSGLNSVSAVAEDKAGAIWIGTADSGIMRIKGQQITSFARTNGLPANSVSSLYVDHDDIVWAGTSGGLARFSQGKWTAFSEREGLPKTSIGYVIEDRVGFIWLGSTAGIIRVKKQDLNDYAAGARKTVQCRLYSRADGLPSSECTSGSQPGACLGHDGRIWFPTIRGICSVNPGELRINSNPPPVVLESILIDDKPLNATGIRVSPRPGFQVRPSAESIEFVFTSLDISAPQGGRFRYRLEPYESAWSEKPGEIRFASYKHLPPGHYTFHVTAANQDGVWNEKGASIGFEVLPPFWRKPWFLALVTLCVFGLVVGSVYFASTQRLQRQLANLRQQEALERERARIARDLHDQLGANLTQIALLGELAEADKELPGEVENHAQQIGHTARETTHALDEIVWTVNPSNDTLDGLANYVCKYAQDYFALAGLKYRLEVPAQLPNSPISPELRHNVFLAVKESVNNVVKHSKATAAWLRLRIEQNQFVFEIEDNGRGIPADALSKGRNGLKNMRKRMEDVGGTFDAGAGAEGGTLVRLSVPGWAK